MMREVPECLQRRYEALDELVKDLSSVSQQYRDGEPASPPPVCHDPGIKLMCKFWNILKEDPDCNLQHAVQQRMALNTQGSGMFGPRDVTCYQMGQEKNPSNSKKCSKESCSKAAGCKPKVQSTSSTCCNKGKQQKSQKAPLTEPLSVALGNMMEAASMERKCSEKTAELMAVQEQLTVQVTRLEEREKDEVRLLKEAEAIWAAMEKEYKVKLEASKQRQVQLVKQHNEVEASANKWRKNKKDLEDQLRHVDKCWLEIKEKFNQKTNDLKCIDTEIGDLEQRIVSNTNDVENMSNVLAAKKEASAKRIGKLREESKNLQLAKSKEDQSKQDKIARGNQCIKEAREELAKICRVLLKKKLENEDLRAEANGLVEELDLLKTTFDQCGEKCKNKEESFVSEIEEYKTAIKKFQLKCTKCHVSTDTQNLRKLCSDCPRCQEEIDPCIYSGDKCTELAKIECICTITKHKLINNVFDNMYTVLERLINTKPGKAIAEQVLECLRRSTNGKLSPETRKNLQNFILAAVKQNLNLTIIGGAVKTRCEMDAESYKELMLCLNKVKVAKPTKEDKGTDSRKEPCARWGGSHECNCPKGPKYCICTKKSARADPEPPQIEELEDIQEESSICPYKKKTSGGKPESDVVTKIAKKWGPSPCAGKSCTFNKNMRAAQCTLGRDFMDKKAVAKSHKGNLPLIVVPYDCESMKETCSCDSGRMKCDCGENFYPPHELVEEILSREPKAKPIESVPSHASVSSSFMTMMTRD